MLCVVHGKILASMQMLCSFSEHTIAPANQVSQLMIKPPHAGFKAHLKHCGKGNAALFAIGRSPCEMRVCLSQAEEVHLGLPKASML